ncbi:hypothetical protein [Corynebacterium poyangense]|uniref:hypothetical protein n=1 Tax=Corynebacterium poyangense TaxID=2684405 RepID=UPI001CCF2DFF|nr:hypothetical protein [Corynebacterium poyangense]
MKEFYTVCFFTKFMCSIDRLDEAKLRHYRCVNMVRERFGFNIYYTSEQAYRISNEESASELILSEMDKLNLFSSQEEKRKYSTFLFITLIDVPYDSDFPEKFDENMRSISSLLDIDYGAGVVSKFPSKTRGARVSEMGNETDWCTYV